MKTIKTFQTVLANNLTLVAAAGLAIGTITFCSAWCYNENCTPGITIDPQPRHVCGSSSVGVYAEAYCDDDFDTVTVDPGSYPLTWSGGYFNPTWWNGSVGLARGLNKLKGHAADCPSESSEVDVACNGGNGPLWLYDCGDNPGEPCAIQMEIGVYCLPYGGYDYKRYETHAYNYGQDCDGARQFTEFKDAIVTKSSTDGTVYFYDDLSSYCPSDPQFNQCYVEISKSWVVYDPLSSFFTQSADTFMIDRSPDVNPPQLYIWDDMVPDCIGIF